MFEDLGLNRQEFNVPDGFFEFTLSTLKDIKGLEPYQIVEYKALCGDTSDNIPGVKGVGEKGVEKLFEGLTTPEEFRNKALQAYVEKSNGVGDAIFKFQQNFRQVYLLRTEEDFINEVGNVPSLPAPIQFI